MQSTVCFVLHIIKSVYNRQNVIYVYICVIVPAFENKILKPQHVIQSFAFQRGPKNSLRAQKKIKEEKKNVFVT